METKPKEIRHISWGEFSKKVIILNDRLRKLFRCRQGRGPTKVYTKVYGIPRGGAYVSCALTAHGWQLAETPSSADILVDDLVQSGKTKKEWEDRWGLPVVPLISKEERNSSRWIVFPWEEEEESEGPATSVTRLIEYMEEDPLRPGLVGTPTRVLRTYQEMTTGYSVDPKEILSVVFPTSEKFDEMIVLKGMRFTSLCEHHLMPFNGTALVAYIPTGGMVVGISKLARLVNCFALRLQIQERMTQQISDALVHHLSPTGSAVILQAHHSCMGCRGVKQPEASMVTSKLTGAFRSRPEARAELMSMM